MDTFSFLDVERIYREINASWLLVCKRLLNRYTDAAMALFFIPPERFEELERERPEKLERRVRALEDTVGEMLEHNCITRRTSEIVRRLAFEHLESVRSGRRLPKRRLQLLLQPFFDFKRIAEERKGFKSIYFPDHSLKLFAALGMEEEWRRQKLYSTYGR